MLSSGGGNAQGLAVVGWGCRAAFPEPIAQIAGEPQPSQLSSLLRLKQFSLAERALCLQGEEGIVKLAAGKDAIG